MIDIYLTRQPPPLGTLYFHELEQKAREKLKDRPSEFTLGCHLVVHTHLSSDAFLYVNGSAGNCAAADANVNELKKWMFIPRMLRDATVRNLEVGNEY